MSIFFRLIVLFFLLTNNLVRMPVSLALNRLWYVEVEMIMLSTPRIEQLPARWAPGFALHILMDGHLRATGATEYGFSAPLCLRPDFDYVIGERGVTVFAGKVDATAFHLDRNNVSGSVIVLAARLRIKVDATNFWKSRNHGRTGKRRIYLTNRQ